MSNLPCVQRSYVLWITYSLVVGPLSTCRWSSHTLFSTAPAWRCVTISSTIAFRSARTLIMSTHASTYTWWPVQTSHTHLNLSRVMYNIKCMRWALPSSHSQSTTAAFAVAGRETVVCVYMIASVHETWLTSLWLWPTSGVPPWNNERCQRDVKWLKSSVNPKPTSGGKNTWHPPSKQVPN